MLKDFFEVTNRIEPIETYITEENITFDKYCDETSLSVRLINKNNYFILQVGEHTDSKQTKVTLYSWIGTSEDYCRMIDYFEDLNEKTIKIMMSVLETYMLFE